jgi:hypothetical protein
MADQTFNVNCGFFDAINYDRTYTADDMNKPYSRVIADGVFATNQGTPSTDLQVISAGSGMNITVSPGQGIFASKWFENPSAILITVPDNTALYPRFDSVIVQVDKRSSGRVGNIVYRTGTPASDPQYPAINTVADVVEYAVAYVYVAAGANAINNDAITDLRGSSKCPWVTGLIQQVDTSTLWAQYQAAYQAYYDSATTDFENYTSEQREAWEEFLQTLTEDLKVTTNVLLFSSTFNATGSATVVPINIPTYNPDTDILQVFINGLLAIEGDEYTVNSDNENITLTTAIKAGNVVNFIVFKSVIGADIESAVTMIRKLDDKLSNFMADSGWINFYLESGAQAYDSNSTPGVRCIGNRVYLRGAIKNLTSNSTFCTLPVAFRPAQDHVYTTSAANSSGTVNDEITITVSATNGTVKLTAKSGSITSTDKISIATSFLAATGNTVSMIYEYMGSVSTYSDLPAGTSVNAGDVYMVQTADPTHNIAAGDDVMWNGSEWELLDSVISSDEIDTIIDSIE